MLADLTVFAFLGFGAFTAHLGNGAYGSELMSTLKLKSPISNPSCWNAGIRAPITARIAHGAASVSWGCANTKFAEDDALMSGDPPLVEGYL